jgi:hypothetical protein
MQPPPFPPSPTEPEPEWPVVDEPRLRLWDRNLLFLLLCLVGASVVVGKILQPPPAPTVSDFNPARYTDAKFRSVVESVDATMQKSWNEKKLTPTPRADDLAIARRLSLALTGTIPSLQEVRAFEAQPEDDRIHWWISRALQDRRHSDYLAERFARAYVGVENGPFIVYRRRRMVNWLSDQLAQNRPYNDLVKNLITAEGAWTSQPESNFITVTIDPNDDGNGPAEVKLAARVTRAFLGVRLDCVQCHDDKFGDRWKQEDFHQLASFFAEADVGFTGVMDDTGKEYEFRYRGEPKEETVPAVVPFNQELLPENGSLRERLAGWVTHKENRPFARAAVNRMWALMFNKPLIDPVDEIPLEGPYPPAMELLTDDLVAHNFDLQRLIRIIASARAFQLDSRAANDDEEISDLQEEHFAAFPLTRLRPEQVAGSVIQSSTLTTINADAHIFQRGKRYFSEGNFVKRFGDAGEDEFNQQGGTIPQRLLMMNGEMVQGQTKPNPFMNSATRIGIVAPDDKTAVETLFLSVFSRRPTSEEAEHFAAQLRGTDGDQRSEKMSDIYWSMLNATEFSWNH